MNEYDWQICIHNVYPPCCIKSASEVCLHMTNVYFANISESAVDCIMDKMLLFNKDKVVTDIKFYTWNEFFFTKCPICFACFSYFESSYNMTQNSEKLGHLAMNNHTLFYTQTSMSQIIIYRCT